ncbi:MAG: hypothetical protein GEU86_20180 [Actinophytocola sp.]|nr:hypothetical protein [Actinophytocola sp.]
MVARGAPLVDQQGTDEFRTHWLALALPGQHAIEIDGPPDKVFAYLSGTAGAGTPEGLRVKGARDAIRRLRAVSARSHASEARVSR